MPAIRQALPTRQQHLWLLPLLFACTPDSPCPKADMAPQKSIPAFACIASDFQSTAIGLLDKQGNLITEAWIDSGTFTPGITAALSGDVVLPNRWSTPGELTVIDRLGVDVLSTFDLKQGRLVREVTAQSSSNQAAYRANPRDALQIDNSLWITRYEPNLDAQSDMLDRGDDVIVIAGQTNAPRQRIDLSAAVTQIDGEFFYARPDRMAQVGNSVVVGLGRLSLDFMRAAPGAVAVISTAEKNLNRLIALPEFTNCGEVVPVPPDKALVLCSGATFAGQDTRREHAGVVLLGQDAQGLITVQMRWRAADHPEVPPPFSGLTVQDLPRVFVVAIDDSSRGDALLSIDLLSGATQVVLQAQGDFVLGQGSYDRNLNTFILPDSQRGIRRFQVNSSVMGYLSELEPIRLPCRKLPLRSVIRLASE